MIQSLTHSIGGVFQPLLNGVAHVLALLYSVIPIYPVDIALLTIGIMAILTPLTVKSTKNMAAMQALGPEMKKLQQKYKGPENRSLLNEEMMKLYKEHKVNPASGCLPMLLQMPAFLVLYDVIRGITNTVGTAGHVTALPRYIGHDTKMYHDIVAAHGQLNAYGMDFSQKLLSHHSSIFGGAPFLLLVVGSVGLQYLQMSRLNARNPKANQANPQAAMMQKYMPLIFGLIYLNVAAIINVYFVFSSGIRILTQEVLFRKGIVASPMPTGSSAAKSDKTGREISRAKPSASSNPGGGAPLRGGSGTSTGARPNSTPSGARSNSSSGKTNSPKGTTTNSIGTSRNPKAGPAPRGNSSTSKSVVRSTPEVGTSPKEHPRAKAKRERKAR